MRVTIAFVYPCIAGLVLISCHTGDVNKGFRQALNYENEWKLAEAQKAISHLKPAGDANRAGAYARILLKQGELNKTEAFLSTLPDSMVHTDRELLYQSSLMYYLRGKLQESDSTARQLLQQARQASDSVACSRAWNILGRIAFNKAAYAEARKHQNRSLEMALATGNRQAEADALRQLGVLSWYNMNYRTATENYLKPALQRYRQTGDKIGEATTLANMGLVYKDQNELEKSVQYNLRAFDIRRKTGDKTGLADSYYFLSNILSISGWPDTFRYTFRRKSLELSLQIGYKWGAEVAARSLVSTYNVSVPLSTYFEEKVDSVVFKSGEGPLFQIQLEALRALKKGVFDIAASRFEDLIRVSNAINHKSSMAFARYGAGKAYLEMEQFQKAEDHLKKSLSLTDKTGNQLQRVHLRYHLALIKKHTNRTRMAKQELKMLAATVDSVYKAEIKEQSKNIFLDRTLSLLADMRRDIYSALTELLFETHDEALFAYIEQEKNALRWGKRLVTNKAGHLADESAYNEFTGAFEKYEEDPRRYSDVELLIDKMTALLSEHLNQRSTIQQLVQKLEMPEPVTRADVQSSLHNNEVFIQYYVGERYLLANIIKPDTVFLHQLAAEPDDLLSVVNVLNETILRGKENANDDLYKAPARHLYEVLVKSLEENEFIRAREQLYISPHRMLNRLPFHALMISPANAPARYLTEKYGITYVPSAAYLVGKRRRTHQKAASILAAAPNPRSLPFTGRELEAIPARLFAAARRLTARRASSDTILKAIGDYDIFHFAGHIDVSTWFPLSSVMQFADRNVRLYELFKYKNSLRLAILSACNSDLISTADPRMKGQDNYNGFARVLLLSGAQNIIATRWLVEDETTAQLMHEFYRQLEQAGYFETAGNAPANNGPAFSIALNNAQRGYLRRARQEEASTHPFYWAAFSLTGPGR